MATKKARINITAEPDTHKALRAAAKREGVPVATKAAELLEVGLALEEDVLLTTIAARRLGDKSKFITHEDAWV